MARPVKQTVDYFPHYCDSNKTIPILENRYGNDGYAFWFKLLELLAKTQGHFYDCNNTLHWEFLLTKTLVKEDTANNILDILANLGKIDSELWQSRVIWCQNLVENVADVYKRRQAETPHRPSYDLQKHMIILVNADNNAGKEGVSDNRNRQSKVKESKVNQSKVESIRNDKDFLNYQEELHKEFNELDIDEEVRKFYLWWEEGRKQLKKPKLALRNWMVKAREIKKEKNNGQTGRPKQKRRTPITVIRGHEPLGPED